MIKKNLKRFAAVTLAATMALGSATMVFAAVGEAEGTGSYEGGEMKYPTLSITLPTIPNGTYDYIADPNELIKDTNNAKYANATFTGTTGIFFKTAAADPDTAGSKDSYTEKSAAQTVTNENAQDIIVTVKLEQKKAGDDIIQYAPNATFTGTDNLLYLAVTDDAATSPQVAALSSTAAAVVTKTVAGVPGNYEAGYDTTKGYEYVKKTSGLTDWNDCSFILTGAINKGATWGDNVKFPEIKVTWSYKNANAVFAEGSSKGTIQYTTANVQEVTSIMMANARGTYDAMVNLGSTYSKATSTADADSGLTTIALDAKYMSFYTGNVDATITYKDASGATKTEVLTLNMN